MDSWSQWDRPKKKVKTLTTFTVRTGEKAKNYNSLRYDILPHISKIAIEQTQWLTGGGGGVRGIFFGSEILTKIL